MNCSVLLPSPLKKKSGVVFHYVDTADWDLVHIPVWPQYHNAASIVQGNTGMCFQTQHLACLSRTLYSKF